MEKLDVVYLVRHGKNEELRYSIRSLVNIPHKDVYIVGHKPDWAITKHIKTKQNESPFTNTANNLKAACLSKDISSDFILMNDDFFIMKPLKSMQTYHRGTYKEVLKNTKSYSAYTRNMGRTQKLLEGMGYENPLCYELHIPIVINKTKMLEALKLVESTVSKFNKRSLYANMAGIGGRKMKSDVKVTDVKQAPPRTTFVSTTETSFNLGKVGNKIRNKFTERSVYEKE